MRTITKIACRTIGTLGMGIALYDAARVAKHHAKASGENCKAAQMERAYFDSRTIDNMSYHSNSIRENVYDLKTKLPLPTIMGKIKGGTEGAISTLGNHIITIGCSAMALLCKGVGAKIGAVGVGLGLLYEVLRNGFGLGKHHPMN